MSVIAKSTTPERLAEIMNEHKAEIIKGFLRISAANALHQACIVITVDDDDTVVELVNRPALIAELERSGNPRAVERIRKLPAPNCGTLTIVVHRRDVPATTTNGGWIEIATTEISM